MGVEIARDSVKDHSQTAYIGTTGQPASALSTILTGRPDIGPDHEGKWIYSLSALPELICMISE